LLLEKSYTRAIGLEKQTRKIGWIKLTLEVGREREKSIISTNNSVQHYTSTISMQEQHIFVRFVLLGAVLVLSTKRAFSLHSISSHDGSEDGSSNTDGNNNHGNPGGASGTTTGTTGNIPFVGPLHLEYQDPFAKGFEITTRVYTDPYDKLAHFDDILLEDNSNDSESTTTDSSKNSKSSPSTKPIVLPYWECGVAGSTTVPVPLSSLTVRHLLGGSKPGSFEGGCGRGETVGIGGGMGMGLGGGSNNDDTHPRLVVPLTPLEIVLNSGQTRIFEPGDVILLENCLTGGHILQGHEGHDMVVVLLTLPHPYHHAGKDRNSLSSIFENNFWKQNPCKTGLANNGSGSGANREGRSDLARWSQSYRLRRRLGLGVIGAGISMALADFLGKVAPLALAVAAGGGLVAMGGTYGLVKLGEFGLDELDFWQERRLLRLQDDTTTTDGSGEAGDEDDDEYVGTTGSRR